ncbi:ninjurin-2-like [Amphiura filiformis]|uniref:ninjurin-2-like n=1 Tax=Amphiura filiformis TaxID=82378 RepID=UPI003B2265BA
MMSVSDVSQSQSVEGCSGSSQMDSNTALRKRMMATHDDHPNLQDNTPKNQSCTEQKIGVIHPHGPEENVQKTLRKTFRAQTYSSTKTVAQGFLNISLLSANAGQLKIVLQQGSKDCMFYELLLIMIGLSFFLQLLVSYLLSSKYMMEMDGYEDEEEQEKCMRHNRWATFLVTLISAVNVIIATFIGH